VFVWNSKVEDDRTMVRSALLQRARTEATQSAHQASVQAKAKDVLLDMRGLPRTYVAKAMEHGWTEGVVVADDRGRPFKMAHDAG